MTKSPTRIGIVEDNDLLRLSLGTSLAQENLEIVFSVSTALEALELIETAKIDVLIADLHLGETINGIDVSLLWQKAHPDLGVVYLTSYEDPRLISGGKSPVMADNSVYVTKSSISEIDQLVQAINLSLEKKGAPKNARTGPLAKLTDVQMETLSLLALGHSNKEIARIRGINEESVAISLNRISKALGLPAQMDRNQRVHLARVVLRGQGK
ncbi:MAG: response regulator transcription factor [Micrococcales bacterium]|jgi:DNA-binding NarL/FixJ family response regulator|nr:response regulator transcription factor [Micrococcales bacterium]|tara:strand:- start:367 stop:1002 length:636 start_codon:yes stop_codon:yes gene_type:complete